MNDASSPDYFLHTPREVHLRWHVPRDFVYDALKSGELKAVHRGRRFLIPGFAVEQWLRDQVARGGIRDLEV